MVNCTSVLLAVIVSIYSVVAFVVISDADDTNGSIPGLNGSAENLTWLTGNATPSRYDMSRK